MNTKKKIDKELDEIEKFTDKTEDFILIFYKELRAVANRLLQKESPDHTLQPTELVHELVIKLMNSGTSKWEDNFHFFSSAVLVMRRILINHAKKKSASKRIPKGSMVPLDTMSIKDIVKFDNNLIKLDDALDKLGKVDEQQTKIVEFKIFAGLKEIEVAELMSISRSTVQREWKIAKMWLMQEMHR